MPPKRANCTRSNEHMEQVIVIQWAMLNTGRWPELAFLFSIPNGAALPRKQDRYGRSYSPQADKLKSEGLLSGVSDLFLPVPRGDYHGLFLEMKYGKNTLTDEQEAFLEFVNRMGYRGLAAWGADQAIQELCQYMELPSYEINNIRGNNA